VRKRITVMTISGLVAGLSVVLPASPALAAQTVETYDAYANGGSGTDIADNVTSFHLDGITYTTDQASTTWVGTSDGGAPLSSGPSDGVLLMNFSGTPMTSVTITLQDGHPMIVSSFDLDSFGSPGTIYLIPDGVTADETSVSGSYSGNVDLSGNSNFRGISSLELLDVGDSGPFVPTLDNFTYTDLSSPPVLTASGGTTSFVAADNAASTPVTVDSGITLTDGDSTTAASATASITGNFHSGEDVLAFTNTSAATYGDISASYVSGTGVLTLTSASGTATIAQWQSALRAITYTDTAVTPNSATRTVSFNVNDGLRDAGPSNTVTKSVSVTDTDQTPILNTTGGTTNYFGGASAVAIDSGVTVSDLDNTTQSSGTVSITTGFHSGDTLGFVNDGSTMGNISASYNSATGVLTATSAGATATKAQWANALRAVTFSSTSTTYSNRTISFAINDGTKTSTAATDTVAVLAPLQLTTDVGSAAFVAGDNTTSTPVAIDSGLTVTDASSPTLQSATVAITGNFHSGEDVLAYTNDGSTMGNIASSYNSGTGVLTLTSSGATATLAQWQSALRSTTYTDTAVTPNNATRTISFAAVDGNATNSNTATRTVTVTDTDQTPIVATTAGTTNYVGGASAVTIDSGVAVSDLDNTTQASATVSVTTGFHSGDTLAFVNDGSTMGNVSASYNSATGVLTLTSIGATSTNAQWTNALRALTFSSTSATYGNRTISFITNDGTKNSTAATDVVDVLGPPTITTDSGSAAFVAGDNTTSTPVAIDSGLTITDGSATTMASATVAITGNFHSGEDVLAYTNDGSTMGNIAGSYNSGTGVLTLTSSGATATLAQWQSALRSTTYTDTAVTPNTATRTISFAAVDSGATTSNTATRTVTVTDTDQTPIVTTTGGTTNYVAGATAATIDGGITVSDLDNTTQASATVSVTTGFHSGDTLTFVNTSAVAYGNVVGSYNSATGVLTLTSSGAVATDAQWSAALSSITFSASSGATPGNRTVAFAVSDGTKNSTAATDVVDVLGPPTITTDSGSAAFVAGDNTTSTPVAIDSGLTITDGSATTMASATVAITGNFHSGEDVLAYTYDGSTMGNIAGSYNAATGVLTLTSSGATATLAQWQSALRSTTYTDTAVTPNTATRTISFAAVDSGATTSNTATRTVTVTDTDQTPIVTTTGGMTNYTIGGTAMPVDGSVSVSDLDNPTQAAATVSIGTGFVAGDTLAFTNTSSATYGNITASYDSATGVLTLTSAGATATDAQWSSALSAVTFATTAAAGDRTISFTANDGTTSSAAATDTTHVQARVVAAPPSVPQPPAGISRVAGADRIATAIAASQRDFPGTAGALPAGAVVLVGANDQYDGLTGAPFAAIVHAPLLFIEPDSVPTTVSAEIARVLGSTGTVYLLGGPAVIGPDAANALTSAGYTIDRIAGPDRFGTAVAIADATVAIHGEPGSVFEASGLGFADALVAGPAASQLGGVVLLTDGHEQAAATAAWLSAHSGSSRYAIGGAAATADPSATAIFGADRYATGAAVATRFFPTTTAVSIVNGQAWADAAVAADASALSGAPLLLVTADDPTTGVSAYLRADAGALAAVTIFGGTAQITAALVTAVAQLTGLPVD
jgi:putative cell wall-binding protein